MKKTVVIVDANNLAYRVAAVLHLNNSKGVDISVPFGVIKSIRGMLNYLNPDKVLVVWDGGRDKNRISLLPQYKQSLKRLDNKDSFVKNHIYQGIDSAQELLELLGIPQYKYVKLEADDVISKLADTIKSNVIIVSTDKDFFQLINSGISIYNPIKGVIINNDNFEKITGLPSPNMYLEYHILRGDKSDNIPGVPGIGEKTAKKLIIKYGNIFDIRTEMLNNSSLFNKRELKLLEYLNVINCNRILIGLREFVEAFNIRLKGNVLNSKPVANYSEFTKMISSRDYDFRSIYQDVDYWLMPFRKVNIRSKYVSNTKKNK